MRHDWVFDVLSDLLAYATRNDLPRLAARVSEALDEARREVDARDDGSREPSHSGTVRGRRMH
jgi:hypothetical protein